MYFKKIILYLLLILFPKKKARIYSKILGIKMGSNVRITHYPRWGSEPYLIKIGDNVTITRGVCFLNHDGGVGLFRDQYPGLNRFGRITIGNNVFIGINTIIMPGIHIGNNVVVAAGAIITKDVPNDVVIAGVPARILSSIAEYKKNGLKYAVMIEDSRIIDRKNNILAKI